MSEGELRVLGLIPARGGSKGVPRKNIRLLAGRPLIGYTIAAAQEATRLDRVMVSTEDEEIARMAEEMGAWVPFRRPAELAQDETPMLPVILQALEWCAARGESFDAVCLLQPTNPRRDGRLIDECIARFAASGADSLVTVLPVPAKYNPHWVYLETADGGLQLSTGEDSPCGRRQDLPAAWHREGSIYVTRWRTLVEERSLYGTRTVGYPIDPAVSVNIDSFDDWARAEELLRRGEGER